MSGRVRHFRIHWELHCWKEWGFRRIGWAYLIELGPLWMMLG